MYEDVESWFNKFSIYLKNDQCEDLACKLIPPFLDDVSSEYFLYVKHKHGAYSLDFDLLRVLFFDKFLTYKVSIVKKAHSLIYDVNYSLTQYVAEKGELVKCAYPEISDHNLIVEILAGIDDVKLVKRFFPIGSNMEDFFNEVKLIECLMEEEEVDLFDLSKIEDEGNDEGGNRNANEEKNDGKSDTTILSSFVNWVSGKRNAASN